MATGPLVAIAPTPDVLAAGLGSVFAVSGAALSLDRLLPAMASLALLASVEALTAAAALREASGRRADYDRDLRGAATFEDKACRHPVHASIPTPVSRSRVFAE